MKKAPLGGGAFLFPVIIQPDITTKCIYIRRWCQAVKTDMIYIVIIVNFIDFYSANLKRSQLWKQ